MRHSRLALRCAAIGALFLWAAASWSAEVDVAAHGKRITLGSGDTTLTVLYLKGTPYEMGYAHGALCKEEVRYIAQDVAKLMMAGMGVTPEKVDAIWSGYEKHLRPEYLEELRGLADGAGLDLKDVQRFHAIPDISEWHCTFFAAAAGTAASRSGLVQIRALDYETKAGIQKYPALIVERPTGGVPFVNVTWLGHCGLVTGMNAAGIAMSEIGDDWDKDNDSFDGRPLNYVMRDAVQFGRTLDEAVNLVKDGPRTTSLLYCLSSGKENQVRALQTSRTQCRVYSSDTLPFPTRPGLVYMSMGVDSSWNKKVGDWLLQRYGTITPEIAQRMMKELRTGSLHAVVFKPASEELWVANATTSTMAYDQPYHHFSLKSALADPFFRK
jgi:hypothetical protein